MMGLEGLEEVVVIKDESGSKKNRFRLQYLSEAK